MTRTPLPHMFASTALALWLLLVSAEPASAYIGPGAGFALMSSAFVLVTTILVAIATLLVWPFRAAWRWATGIRRPKARIRRLVIVGLDGQDPRLTDQFMREGLLPHFSALAASGSYQRLQTTYPALSPVAWSSFSTGTHPARHNIFDFLDRDRRTYLPRLSSAVIGPVTRVLRLGRFRLPLGRPDLRLLRRSKPFWTILGEHRIWSTILRVPITFPPDQFHGAELSAMCVPDLLGTQGTFLLASTRPATGRFKEGGIRLEMTRDGAAMHGVVTGPPNTLLDGEPPLTLPLRVAVQADSRTATVTIGGTRVALTQGVLSDWVTLSFPAVPGMAIAGLTRLLLTECSEHISLYLSPINLDPERPAMPISHPPYFASYMAARIGAFSTLGLAEDTWALNEGVTDEATFLQQAYDIDREREAMLHASLDRLDRGALVCVFDATDRIQHMFWRHLEPAHPAARRLTDTTHRHAIRDLYVHNDALVGRVRARLSPDDVLMVISDHGFTSFRRGVSVNEWLRTQGLLTLKPGTDGRSEWLRDVDWSQTRAYALGLSGIYLNLKGREAEGIVAPGNEATAVKAQIMAGLRGLRDEACDAVAITDAFDTAALYAGPYLDNAPDLIVGYNHGYRISWDAATGMVTGPVFEDNTKAWSGDHGVDPRLVPGVFFCNRPTQTVAPSIIDLAPTALTLFGITPPAHMEGRPLEGLA